MIYFIYSLDVNFKWTFLLLISPKIIKIHILFNNFFSLLSGIIEERLGVRCRDQGWMPGSGLGSVLFYIRYYDFLIYLIKSGLNKLL